MDLLKSPKHKSQKSVFHYLIKKLFEKKLNLYSYNTSEYIKDMGTPARILDVKYDLNKKVVENKSYLKTQKALFLDRDNTIIHCPENKYINKTDTQKKTNKTHKNIKLKNKQQIILSYK